MKAKPWLCSSLLLLMLLTGVFIGAFAKRDPAAKDENGAVILGQAGESYPIYGAGGIVVRGGHHGFFSSNMKSSQIEIDGSAIVAEKLVPMFEAADFSAAANGAYFVTKPAVCSLATANGALGQEILVCNAGSGVTITYQTVNGESLFGVEQTGVLFVNKTQGRVDRFISDGKSWYRQ
jgi:hypothetical protein